MKIELNLHDAQGNHLTTLERKLTDIDPEEGWDELHIQETMLYGSDRLGVRSWQKSEDAHPASLIAKRKFTHNGLNDYEDMPIAGDYTGSAITSTAPANYARHLEGLKRYELKNHLGNVLATVSDKRDAVDDNGDVLYYQPKVDNVSFFYPYGMLMTGLSDLGGEHRFGFNGQEKVDEVNGIGNHINFTFRGYDPLTGRFWSVDPLTRTYPWYAPYQFAGNSPIAFIDLDGLERVLAISFDGSGEGATNYRIGHLRALNGDDISSQILTADIGDQIANAFINASKKDANGIGFVAIWGHGSPNSMWGNSTPHFMKDDLDALQDAIDNGDVKFTSNAIIYIGNCNAGTCDPNNESFAQKIADLTGKQVIAGRTDEYGGTPSGRGSVGPVAEVTGKSMKYTMSQPSYDTFFSFRKGKDPVAIGSKIELKNWLERGKQLPMTPVPNKRPNSLSPNETGE